MDKIDNLHIPHINFLNWYSENNSSIASAKDKNPREFGLRFFLEDLQAGTTWTYVTLEEEQSQSIVHNDETISFFFEKNEHGYLQSILVVLNSIGCIEAFKKSSQFIFPLLSTLSFFYRRPFKINQIKVIDETHKAELSTRKTCPQSKKLKIPLVSFANCPLGSLFAIYSDGINSVDIAYRYICFFKIYEAWHEHSDKYFGRDDKSRPKILISRNLLAGAYQKKFHQELLNKYFDDDTVYTNLNRIRKYLVHPVIDRGVPPSFFNLDLIETLEALEVMSNLMERIATKILDTELNLLAKTDLDIKKLLEIYNNSQP